MAKSALQTKEKTDDLGALPVWDLSDLYDGMDSPEVKRDLERAAADEPIVRGTLQGKAEGDRRRRPMAALGLPRRSPNTSGSRKSLAGSAATRGLVHAGDTSDPVRAKFYGDLQDRLTTISTHLLFFELELNRLDDALIEKALETPALAIYRPWIEDLRLERPYQLDDQIERLFHEKSVTGRSAWNRLFDETLAALRFSVEGETLPLEPTLNRLVDPDEARRKQAADALAATFKENLRLFTHITNVLAKDKSISDEWRGFKDVAASRHLSNRVEPEVVDALVARRARRLSPPVASLLRAEGALARQGKAGVLGPQRAAAGIERPPRSVGRGAEDGARRLWRLRRRHGGDRRTLLRPATGSTRRRGRARRPALSRIRPSRRSIPTCF